MTSLERAIQSGQIMENPAQVIGDPNITPGKSPLTFVNAAVLSARGRMLVFRKPCKKFCAVNDELFGLPGGKLLEGEQEVYCLLNHLSQQLPGNDWGFSFNRENKLYVVKKETRDVVLVSNIYVFNSPNDFRNPHSKNGEAKWVGYDYGVEDKEINRTTSYVRLELYKKGRLHSSKDCDD